MSAKVVLIFCAQALLVQFALGQCAGRVNLGAGLGCGLSSPIAAPCGASGLGLGLGYGNAYGAGLGYGAGQGYGAGLAIEVVPTSGGALPVTSSSAIAPNGLSVSSENVYEGVLSAAGELPFLSAVALEGVFPSAGVGAVSYSCGNGVTAIESIAPAAAIVSGAGEYGAGVGGYGYGAGAYGAGLGAYGAGLGSYGIGAGCGAPALTTGCGCGGFY